MRLLKSLAGLVWFPIALLRSEIERGVWRRRR
jgi:hypothetical protein